MVPLQGPPPQRHRHPRERRLIPPHPGGRTTRSQTLVLQEQQRRACGDGEGTRRSTSTSSTQDCRCGECRACDASAGRRHASHSTRQRDRQTRLDVSRLPRPCLDCPTIIKSGSRCSLCQARRERTRRPNTTERGYNSSWQRLSARLIRRVGRCEHCGARHAPGNPLTTDHIIPLSKGGQSVESNAQVLCRRCNSSKGTRQ